MTRTISEKYAVTKYLLKKILFTIRDCIPYSRFYVKHCAPARRFPGETRRISVAIPHYNYGSKIHQALKNIWNDERIDDIVIVDDYSSESSFSSLKRNCEYFCRKIRLFRQERNRGGLATKLEAVSRCRNRWVILLDADNTLFPCYTDALFRLAEWSPDTIYCSDRPFPFLDFTDLGGRILDFDAVCTLVKEERLPFAFLNDGNYFVNRDTYLDIMDELIRCQVYASDVLFTNYVWLSNGNKLHIVKNVRYYHRVQPKSYWIRKREKSLVIKGLIHERLHNRRPYNSAMRRYFEEDRDEEITPVMEIPLSGKTAPNPE